MNVLLIAEADLLVIRLHGIFRETYLGGGNCARISRVHRKAVNRWNRRRA